MTTKPTCPTCGSGRPEERHNNMIWPSLICNNDAFHDRPAPKACPSCHSINEHKWTDAERDRLRRAYEEASK